MSVIHSFGSRRVLVLLQLAKGVLARPTWPTSSCDIVRPILWFDSIWLTFPNIFGILCPKKGKQYLQKKTAVTTMTTTAPICYTRTKQLQYKDNDSNNGRNNKNDSIDDAYDRWYSRTLPRWPPVVALGLPLRPSMTSGWAPPALLRDLSRVGVILLMRRILVNFSICSEPS